MTENFIKNLFNVEFKEKYNYFDLVIGFISMFVALAAFLINFGWMRIFLIFTLFAPLFALIYLIDVFVLFFKKARSNLFYLISLLKPLGYVFLSDFGDSGPGYFLFNFFKTSENSIIGNLTYPVLLILFVAFVLSIVLFIKLVSKKKEK